MPPLCADPLSSLLLVHAAAQGSFYLRTPTGEIVPAQRVSTAQEGALIWTTWARSGLASVGVRCGEAGGLLGTPLGGANAVGDESVRSCTSRGVLESGLLGIAPWGSVVISCRGGPYYTCK